MQLQLEGNQLEIGEAEIFSIHDGKSHRMEPETTASKIVTIPATLKKMINVKPKHSMKKRNLFLLTILMAASYPGNEAATLKVFKQKALQAFPLPRLFAPGIVSTKDDESGVTFTPDGKTCYFTMKSPSTISNSFLLICVSHLVNSRWSSPEIAPFSGTSKDFNPMVSPDGNKLFFISNRPVDGQRKSDTDIWVMKRFGDGWSEPANLGEPVNSKGLELGCSVTLDGTLYFSSTGETGNPDIYCSRLKDGKYQKPERLDDAINSDASEGDPFIAPDESYLIFASTGRSGGLTEAGASAEYPRGDLYISYRKDGKWTPAKSLGSAVNSTAEESGPFVSGDGKMLYFSSERNFITIPMKKKLDYNALEKGLHGPGNGLGDIYKIPAAVFLKQQQTLTD